MNLSSMTDEDLIRQYNEVESLVAKYDILQNGLKILLNSGYGASANAHFLYYLLDNAESITTTGQLVNRWTSDRVNSLINNLIGNKKEKRYIIANDTDSMYVDLADVVDYMDLLDKSKDNIIDNIDMISKEIIEPAIRTYTDELKDYLNHYDNKMVWGREVISSASINVAKKRYVMMVEDDEGLRYPDGKMSITGLDSKRSSTPAWAKKALEDCYLIALNKDQDALYKYIDNFKGSIYNLDVSDIAIPTGVNGVEKYSDGSGGYILGTPKQVRAAIVHNKALEDLGLKHIHRIQSGTKIKMLDLKTPNPFRENVIGFVGFVPAEFDIDLYVNRDAIFERGFTKPLQHVLDAIGWSGEKIITLF